MAPQTIDSQPTSVVAVNTSLSDSSNEEVKLSPPTEEHADSIYPAPPPSLDSRPPFDKHTVGLVTTLEQEDYQVVVKALETPAAPLTSAGIMPPDDVVYRFCNYFPPGTPFSYMLMRLHEICQSSHGFHICRLKDQVAIADAVHEIENLDIHERLILVSAPVSIRDKSQILLIKHMAKCIAEQRGGALLDIPDLNLEILDGTIMGTRAELSGLETLHKGLIMYMWLSFRFPGIFTTRPLANHAKELVEIAIEKCLRMLNFQDRAKARKLMREKAGLTELSEDILKQDWLDRVGGEGGVIKNKILEAELTAAIDEVVDQENEFLDDVVGEVSNIEESTVTNDMGVDDESEYPEETDGEEEGEEELDLTTSDKPLESIQALDLADDTEVKEGAKSSASLHEPSTPAQQEEARPQ